MPLRLSVVLLPALLLAFAGCARKHHLSVQGELDIEVSGSNTGFQFADDTRLDDPREAPLDGRIAGYCTYDEAGDVLTVGLTRTSNNPPVGIAIRDFDAQMDPSGGHIEATLGDTLYTGESTACTTFTREGDDDDFALVELNCTLTDGAGQSASLTASLDFANCDEVGDDD